MIKVTKVIKLPPNPQSKVIGHVVFETEDFTFTVKIVNTVKGYLASYPSYKEGEKWVEYFSPLSEDLKKEVETMALASFKSEMNKPIEQEEVSSTSKVPW